MDEVVRHYRNRPTRDIYNGIANMIEMMESGLYTDDLRQRCFIIYDAMTDELILRNQYAGVLSPILRPDA